MTVEGRALLFCDARDMFQQPAPPVNSRRRREPSGARPKNFVALCNRPRFRAYRVYGPGSICRSAVPGRSRMLTRRTALSGLAAIASASLLQATAARAGGDDHVAYSDAEWRARLTPEQYEILRKEGTERPFSSPLLHEERKGVFACAGCGLDLFSSSTKFDSGTGWPSFWAPLDNAVDDPRGQVLGHDPHSRDLPSMRRPSRPRVRRRTEADRPALLHERRGADLQAGDRLRRPRVYLWLRISPCNRTPARTKLIGEGRSSRKCDDTTA